MEPYDSGEPWNEFDLDDELFWEDEDPFDPDLAARDDAFLVALLDVCAGSSEWDWSFAKWCRVGLAGRLPDYADWAKHDLD